MQCNSFVRNINDVSVVSVVSDVYRPMKFNCFKYGWLQYIGAVNSVLIKSSVLIK